VDPGEEITVGSQNEKPADSDSAVTNSTPRRSYFKT
jgi:hypothetical protein